MNRILVKEGEGGYLKSSFKDSVGPGERVSLEKLENPFLGFFYFLAYFYRYEKVGWPAFEILFSPHVSIELIS